MPAAKNEQPQEPVAPEAPSVEPEAPSGDEPTVAPVAQVTEAQMERVTRDTASELAAQEKRRVRLFQVPAGSTDSRLPDETVCVNGHIFQIQRGVEVEVPETVYQILVQAGRV